MIVKLADLIIEIKARYKYTYDMCRDYLCDDYKKINFTVFATQEQLEAEKIKTPDFPPEILENTCIYRNLCTQILKYNAVFIHSAAISVDNHAYLFSANSGTGKTTHMNLWLKCFGERAFVINGDKPILRISKNNIFVYGTPWCGKEGENKNVSVPLSGICILERSNINRIEKIDTKNALLFLLSQTIHPSVPAYKALMFDNLGQVLERIPVYKLGCNMDSEACCVAYNAMKPV